MPDSRQNFGTTARWKVQLELDPAEIALVYRQGLARGAEVCRRGTQEWRPLVITPELRPALSAWSTLRGLNGVVGEGRPPALTLTQTVQINDPSLAAFVLRRRPSVSPSFVAPPPPVVVTRSHAPGPTASAFTSAFTAAAVPELMPAALPPLLPPPRRATSARLSRLAQHARPAELTLAAAIAVVLTLAASLLAERAASSRSASASLGALSALPAQAAAHGSAALRALDFGPSANIPVVAVRDLPVEPRVLASSIGSPPVALAALGTSAGFLAAPASPSVVDAGAIGRAMTLAERVAKGCGPGPVNTQIVTTFAPSGVVRAVHYAAGAPPAPLRSCVLRTIARARVKPFRGAAVTVSKTLRW